MNFASSIYDKFVRKYSYNAFLWTQLSAWFLVTRIQWNRIWKHFHAEIWEKFQMKSRSDFVWINRLPPFSLNVAKDILFVRIKGTQINGRRLHFTAYMFNVGQITKCDVLDVSAWRRFDFLSVLLCFVAFTVFLFCCFFLSR